MLNSATINGGASAVHARHASDFYETPKECVIALLKHRPDLKSTGGIWEPACGDGAITHVLSQMGLYNHGGDIRTTKTCLGGMDFLKITSMPAGTHWILTNPPFIMATEFIDHARSFNVPFAMLLKSSFWHVAANRDLFTRTGPQEICPFGWRPNMAPDRGNSPTMEFLWTIWGAQPADFCTYYPLAKPVL